MGFVDAATILLHVEWYDQIEQFMKTVSRWYALKVPLPKPWPGYVEGDPGRRLERVVDGVTLVVYNFFMFDGRCERVMVSVSAPGEKKKRRRVPDAVLLKGYWNWRLVEHPNLKAITNYTKWTWKLEGVSETVLTQLSDIAGVLEEEAEQLASVRFEEAKDAQAFLEALWQL